MRSTLVPMTPRALLITVAAGTCLALSNHGRDALDPIVAADGAGSGAIAGKISFSGTAPPLQRIKLSADPTCAALHRGGLERQPVKVKDGGVADVLVYVKSGIGGSYPAPAEPLLLDQIGCDYKPNMIVVMVGQAVRIRNSDETLHNIHPRPTVNKEFNVGQPRKGMEVSKSFEKAELMIPTGCDVHPWMRAYISVMAHPFFAVTGEDGSYKISALPDGEYEVEAVHGQLKSAAGKVSVKDGKTSALDLTLKP